MYMYIHSTLLRITYSSLYASASTNCSKANIDGLLILCRHNSLGQGVFDALEADSYFNLVRWQEVDDNPKKKKIKSHYKTLKTEARSE